MFNIKTSLLLLLISIQLLFSSNIQAQVNPALADALQYTLDSAAANSNLKGVSAAVVLPDKSVWTGVSGMSDPDSNQAITADMHFGIGSITKTFVTAIIMQLAAEGRLSLDDSLHKWLPSFRYIDSSITIKQLLGHTSGIYNYTNNSAFWSINYSDLDHKFTPEEILTYIRNSSFTKGTNWEYSNSNFILLGMIINAVTGTDFKTQLHNRITIPFNLSNTFIEVEDTVPGSIADPWSNFYSGGSVENASVYPRTAIYSGAWTAGAIFSTASDVAIWTRLLYGGEVVQQNYLDEMTAFSGLSGYSYGLGTIKNVVFGREWWGHSGGIIGYESYTGYSPQDNISIALITNRDRSDLSNVVNAFLRKLLYYDSVYVSVNPVELPERFYLYQNYPNPFNPITNLGFQIPDGGFVSLKIFDLLGNEVATIVNEVKAPGYYEIKFDGSALSSGLYIYKLESNGQSLVKKMLLMK